MAYQIKPAKGSPGAKLRRARKKLKMTQAVFAKEVLGISKSFLSQLETGARGVRDSALLELLEHNFGIDPKHMLAIAPYHSTKLQRTAARKRKVKP